MDGMGDEVLGFLIDIQEHGAGQLKALSAEFGGLGSAATQVSTRLREMEAQALKTGHTIDTTTSKVTAGSKAQTAGLASQARATQDLGKAQLDQAGAASRNASAQDRATAATKVSTDAAKANATANADSAAGLATAGAGLRRNTEGHASHASHVSAGTQHLTKFRDTTKEVGHTLNQVSLPLLAIGGLSIKMSMDFEAAMSRLHTQAGYAVSDVQKLEKEAIKAAPELRRTPTELADGLYHVASVGVEASKAMDVLKAASIGANVGGADYSATVHGLTEVIKSLHQPASKATEDMALLNEIVGHGDVHMEELVESLGKVLPQAQNFGVSLKDVGGAMDIMTSRGIDANMAATRLGMSFHLLASPTSSARKAFETIGLSADSLATALREHGLTGAIGLLKHHLDEAFPEHGGRSLSVDEQKKSLLIYKKALEETGVSGKSLGKDLQAYAAQLEHGGSAAVEQARILSTAFGGGRQSTGILMMVQNYKDLKNTISQLPEGAQAIHKLMDANAVWEKTSAAQYDHVKASFSSAMTALGKGVGPPVLGALTHLAEGTQHVVERFEALPKSSKHLIEGFVGLLAIAGPVATTMSKIAGAALLIEKMRGNHGGGTPSLPGVSADAAAVAGAIYGFNGPEMPGSKMNPLAVLVLDSPGGGVGGGSTVNAAERDAKKAGKGSIVDDFGNVVGPAEGGVLAGAESVGAGTLAAKASSIGKVGKTLLGRGLKGGMIGLGGVAVSDIAGTLIGGGTGKAVSTIGSDASIGAGIGSLVGPEGTVVGAVGGALVGGLTSLLSKPSFGDKMASELGKGMAPAAQHAIKTTIDAQRNAQTAPGARLPGGRGGPGIMHPHTGVQESDKEAYAGGAAIAASVEHKAEGFKHVDFKSTIDEAVKYFAMVPARARDAGVQSMIEWTRGMEQQGKLPRQSVDRLITDLEKRWPELAPYLSHIGMNSIRALTKSLEGKEAVEAGNKTMAELKGAWQGLEPVLKHVGGNLQAEWGQTLDYLVGQTHSKMPGVPKAASDALRQMAQQTGPLMAGWAAQLTEKLRSGGQKGAAEFRVGMSAMVGDIKTLMKLGLVATKEGDDLINGLLAKELQALGGQSVARMTGAAVSQTEHGSGHTQLHATGGRVPGAVGPDNVPVWSPRGALRGIVAGQELLIANRHTEARVNQLLAPYGTSLGHEVAGETRPHNAPMMASGGRLARMEAFASAETARHDPYLWGGGHDGGFTPPYDCSGAVSADLHAAGLLSAPKVASEFMGYGKPGPGKVTIYASPDHVYMSILGKGFGTSMSNPGGGAAWFNAGPRPGFVVRHVPEQLVGGGAMIATPKWHGPGGQVGAIGKAAVAQVAHAANAKLMRALTHGAAGGGDVGEFGASAAGSLPAAARAELNKLAAAKHWSVPDWLAVIGKESGGNPAARNASGAYGIGQALGATQREYPKMVSSNPATQIEGMAEYMAKRYGGPAGALAHEESAHWYTKGGRSPAYAGAFAHGGAVTAHGPTMAMFGENGTETAMFVPHAAAGARLLEEIGVPVPSTGTSEKATEGLNPDNNEIEYHTAKQWADIRAHHSQRKAGEKASGKTAHPLVEDPIHLGKLGLGTFLDKAPMNVDLSRDVGKLSAEVWKKVVASIEKTLKDHGGNAAFDVQATRALAEHAHSPRMKELAVKAVRDTSSTVLNQVKEAPSTESVSASRLATNQLQVLIGSAQRLGQKQLVSGLLKGLQQTTSSWQQAISSAFTKTESGVEARANLKLAQENIKRIHTLGAGSTPLTLAANHPLLKEREKAIGGEIHSFGEERKALEKAEREAIKHHNAALAKQLKQQISEVDTSLSEAKLNLAQIRQEYLEAIYEALKKTIEQVQAGMETNTAHFASVAHVEEGQRRLEGRSDQDLEEVKGKQEGVLTSSQIAQAKANLAAYKYRAEQQIQEDERQRAYDQSQVGALSGEDRTNMERKIDELSGSIIDLKDGIVEQTKSTEKLTEATNQVTKTFGGTVGFSFNGQEYLAGGQSSHSAPNIGVGI